MEAASNSGPDTGSKVTRTPLAPGDLVHSCHKVFFLKGDHVIGSEFQQFFFLTAGAGSGSYNLGSTNNVESPSPARVWEELHQNMADPRELVTES